MNIKQRQLEVCKAILESKTRRCYCTSLDENEIAVTTTGFDVFIFNKKDVIFDVSKIQHHDALASVCADDEQDKIIKKTGKLFANGGKVYEMYENEFIEVYADTAIANKFSGAGTNFFAHSSSGRILVKDMFGRKIGAFLPVRFNEKELKQ